MKWIILLKLKCWYIYLQWLVTSLPLFPIWLSLTDSICSNITTLYKLLHFVLTCFKIKPTHIGHTIHARKLGLVFLNLCSNHLTHLSNTKTNIWVISLKLQRIIMNCDSMWHSAYRNIKIVSHLYGSLFISCYKWISLYICEYIHVAWFCAVFSNLPFSFSFYHNH